MIEDRQARYRAGKRVNARAVLANANIAIGQDFFTLAPSQVCELLEEADRVRYQIRTREHKALNERIRVPVCGIR